VKQRYRRSLIEIPRIVADTAAFFSRARIHPSLRPKVDLALEELFVNLVTYNKSTGRDILVEMRAIDGGIEVRLTDYDVDRFDPEHAPQADVAAPLDQRSPGGLGLRLAREMADTLEYEYHDRTSRITFTTCLRDASPAKG
jgi:serine/threonine-protein kinase RsbW